MRGAFLRAQINDFTQAMVKSPPVIKSMSCELAALGFANGPPSFPNPEKKRVPPIAHKSPKDHCDMHPKLSFCGHRLGEKDRGTPE